MSVSAQTIATQTTVVALTPTFISDVTTTTTAHLATTLFATQGQTLTITSPDDPQTSTTSTTFTTRYLPTTTTASATVTLTELDIYLQNTRGEIYSTWIIPFPVAATNRETPTPITYVVQPGNESDGGEVWDNWTARERAGLIVGVILAAVLIFGVVYWYFMRKNNVWLAHGWWPWMGQGAMAQAAPGPPAPPAMNMVQPTHVNGVLMSYGYGPGYSQPNGGFYGVQH
ncbi:hypothetical protein LTR84_002392 [Exophiala bonariae]|uniref:Mid2 domain-containing protein n=1 Tax=Exophiala bonariae TaxID=1690606 RepID=A0AAV9N9E3_9EURO|nr:hypothetical protein LTR84_002392 [Exophiala bonariae]